MPEVRLQRFLAECGIGSRRYCEELIRKGRVLVNQVPAELGTTIDPDRDTVQFDSTIVKPEPKVYILLNKPRGVITSLRDPHHDHTIMDCLNGISARVFPVGRLDIDVEGALLLTNDGDLAYRLTHPKHGIEKVYLAWVKGKMSTEAAMRLEKGIKLDDGVARPSRVVILNQGKTSTLIEITMKEGRKREIKRMCSRIGHDVLELRRISIGNIQLGGIQPGEWRFLRPSEVHDLKKLVGMH